MVTGVDGTSGANAQKTVVLVLKHEIGCAITQHLMMAEKSALPAVHSIQNLECAIRKVAQVATAHVNAHNPNDNSYHNTP